MTATGLEGIILDVLSLFFLGTIVGLSGAIIPGPLLAFTVYDTSKKGKMTGHNIIFGHVLWESVIILIILLGFGGIITKNRLLIYIIGGIALLLMGVSMTKSKGDGIKMENSRVSSSLVGGVFYTAFNPTQLPWWATGGLAILLTGIDTMGMMGVIIVTVGHWFSDFAYYIFVSFIVNRQNRYINPHQREISIILGAFMVLIGIYFLIQVLQQLML